MHRNYLKNHIYKKIYTKKIEHELSSNRRQQKCQSQSMCEADFLQEFLHLKILVCTIWFTITDMKINTQLYIEYTKLFAPILSSDTKSNQENTFKINWHLTGGKNCS